MANDLIREKLLIAGANNLNKFGYPSASKDNILTDYLYRSFFAHMLETNKGLSLDTDAAIDALLDECRKADAE